MRGRFYVLNYINRKNCCDKNFVMPACGLSEMLFLNKDFCVMIPDTLSAS